MALNYVKLSAVAQKLIDENGRELQLIHRPTSQAVSDSTRPWRGNNNNAGSGSGGPVTVNITGVFLKYSDKVVIGDFVKRGTQYVLVSQNDAVDDEGRPVDVRHYSELIDSLTGEVWNFTDVETIGPGNLVIFYRVHVRQ